MKHSTHCNCKDCCIKFADHSKMELGAFKKAVARKGFDMFGADVHEKWTGSRDRPVLTREEERQIPPDSHLL